MGGHDSFFLPHFIWHLFEVWSKKGKESIKKRKYLIFGKLLKSIQNGNDILNIFLWTHQYFQLFQAQEVEETMKRIQSHKGIVGTIIVNSEGKDLLAQGWRFEIIKIVTGVPIKTTLDNTTTVQYAGLISSLADKARSVVRDLDPSNDLTFLRIRSKKHEIMVAPDKEFILIVVQNPVDWFNIFYLC